MWGKRVVAIVCTLCVGRVVAQNSFSQDLTSAGINVQTLLAKPAINRYDLARILQASVCQDCVMPSVSIQSFATPTRWEQVTNDPAHSIDDIALGEAVYGGHDYALCVGTVVDNGWMSGYPRAESPYCHGKFCGTNTINASQAIEAFYAVVRDRVGITTVIDWQAIEERKELSGSVLSFPDQQAISRAAERCTQAPCPAADVAEIDAYMAYCTYRPESCGFATYPGFSVGTRPLGPLNVLIRQGVISQAEARELVADAAVSGEQVFTWSQALMELVDCEFVNDYDADRVLNRQDNCPYTYNPRQENVDGDGQGDVCDDDIDGDGVPNPIGIVDYKKNINITLLGDGEVYDNCFYIPNPDQTDTDGDGRGDVCDVDEKGNIYALDISADPVIGTVPLAVNFAAETVGEYDRIRRNFGDNYFGEGLAPTHTYTKPGRYVVIAYAENFQGETIIAKLPIEVYPSPDQQIGYAIVPNTLTMNSPASLSFTNAYVGKLQQITWKVGEQVFNTDPDELRTHTIATPGRWTIESQAYDPYGSRVGLSQVTIGVIDAAQPDITFQGLALQASSLRVEAGDTVTFTTQMAGFDISAIKEVIWEYGVGSPVVTASNQLSTTRTYTVPGAYVVSQTLVFENSEIPPLQNILTVYVQPDSEAQTTIFNATPLSTTVGEGISFAISLQEISLTDISSVYLNRGDTTTQIISSPSNADLSPTHTYLQPGSYPVQAIVYTDAGQVYVNEMTVYVAGGDLCMDEIDTLICDLDDDDLPDLCDPDLDGDGHEQRLTLLLYENTNCTFTDNVDQQELALYHAYVLQSGTGDNCPFVANPDQADQDNDGWGDLCDPAPTDPANEQPTEDTDGDGIPDEADGCPTVPESMNGYQDADGCPELPGGSGDGGGPGDTGIPGDNGGGSSSNDDTGPNDPFIEAEECDACPCPYADYSSALWKGDRVRALLLDPGGSYIYDYSSPKLIEKNIPQELGGN